MQKRKSKYIKALAVVLSMITIMAGLPIPATIGYSIGEEIMEPAAEQPEEVMEPETIAEEIEIDESEEVLSYEEMETEQPQDEPPQEEPPADAEGQTEIAPEAPTESVSPDEAVTEEIPENAPSEEHPLEEQPVQDDSVLIEESEETEEPAESTEEQPNDEVSEDTLPDELPAEEVMPEDDGVEAELEESTTDEILEYEHPVKTALLSSGYAYLMTDQEVQAFASPDMQEVIFTISPNGILLVTAFIEQETNILEVQFMTASGETITGYVYADELPDNLLTSSDIDAAALVTNFTLVFVGDGKVAVFEVTGETNIPIPTETLAEMEQPAESPEEDAPSELPVETPDEDDPFEQPEEPQLEDSPLEESSQSEETELPPAEDETMEEVPESDVLEEAPMMFAAAPMLYASYPYGFSLREHYGYTGYFYAGQTNVHGSSGDDSYPQLAASDEEGTIYATPHYLDGVVVYCLEHKYPGPGERDGDDDYEPTGPYTIVDLAGYKTTPGYSGDVFSDRTIHAIAWVIRHSYPFMVIDSYDSENENWSRAAGQFAIRQVIRELEGKEYVRSYWDLDDFYRRADSAPAEYLEYARWLAANAIAYGESAGTINVSNKSVSYSNGMCIGTVTVTTDAGQMRVSRSVGSMTGHSGGQDGSYYYLYSGDTVTVSAAGTGFTMTIETMASSDEEAYFLVGVSDERIQKVIIPQEGEPYPLASTSVSFEVPHGSVSVTKKDADSGAALSGAVFELLSGSSILQTVTTGANGTATFSNVQPGSYTVREVSAPEGYRLVATSTQNVSVSIGQTASVTFNNEQKEGKIRIVKTDQLTGRPLAGAEFTITRLSAPPAAGNTGVGESVVITTDANGHAETGWLPYGRYRVEETGVPENYVDNRLSTTVDAYEDGQTYTVEVQNEPLKGYISLTKTDRLDGQPIAGVQFDIFHNDEYGDGLAGTMTTNANGVATSPPLRKGSYIVREHGEPTGYITELVEFEAAVEPDETTELTATNQPIQGYIRIVKSDDLTGAVLADAEFTITRVSGLPSHNGNDDGEVVAVITTDENGVATSPLLTWGTYRVEETGVPEHYVDKQFSVDVSISEHMQTYLVVVENEPTKGTIRLTKTDRLDGQPIAGVQFDIYHNDEYGTGAAGTMTTDADGIAISPPLRKGNYIVREHAEPTGYVTELVELESTVYPDETTDLTVTNQPIQGYIRIVKSDELTGEAFAGAEFTITRVSGLPSHNGSNDGEVVAVITTDANGVAVSPLLTWGTYRVTETGVPVHYVDNSFSVDVNVSEHMNTYEVAVENEPTKGWIRLVKTDRLNGNPIAGVQFDIYYNDQYGEGLAATMVTDENGVAVSQALRKGQYLIREHGATAGYYFEETMLQATVRSDETTELVVTNQPVMVQLKLYKRDKDEYTGNPADVPTVRGDGLLADAEFQVLAAENIVDRQGNIIQSKGDVVIESIHTNGADASATTVELWPGLYEFIELTPPTGYQASSQRVQIDASGAAQQSEVAVITYEGVITNEIRYGAQAIVKILGENSLESDPTRVETPEEGAEFAVYLKKAGSYAEARDFERDYLVTDERGYAMTKALPYGVYVLQQTAGEDGYEIKGPITFEINGTESLINPPPLTLNDKPILYRLRFIKVDSETGNPITLSNASFKLKDADGQYVTQTVYYPREMDLDTFTTDDTGSVTLPETVGWGLYTIEEVTAPEGYLLSDEEIEIFVGNSGDTPGSIYELEIEIPNDPVKGRIVLNKTGSQLTGFTVSTDAYGNEVHTPIFEDKPLAGAVFELRAAEDIVGGDGTVRYQAGAVIGLLTTSTDGENAFSDLPLGHYHLFELSAPDGYVFSTEPHAVELLYAGDQTAIVEATVTISNAYLPAEISLQKEKQIIQTHSHADGTVTRSVETVSGEGFVFGLYCDSDIHYNGGTLMADTLIAAGTTDEDGLLTFSGCYPHGEYYVRELHAPDGWKISAERYPVSITPEGEAADAEIIRVELPAAILNELVYSHVTLTKTDLTGANALPGATIEVQDAEGNVIFRDVTDENGEVADIPVTHGSYTFREVYAPEGYELSEAVFSFTVDENGHVSGDTIVRDDYTRFCILKHDEYVLPMEGVEFGLLDEAGTIIMRTMTDENGLATFEKVPYGSFRVVETKPLAGYVRSELNVEVNVDGTLINPTEPLATVVNRMNEVLLQKEDQDGQPLAGATFGLYNEFGECIKLSTSDASGMVSFRKIPFGRYTIREMEAPDGYLPSKEEISLTIDESYQNSGQPIATVVNQQKRVQYRKVDTSGNTLAGVEFSLINAVTLEVVETVTSNANGEFIFTQFDYGDWIIRETKAPEGFVPMEDVLLHVDENWTEPEPITLVNIPNHFWFFKSDHQKNALPGVTFGVEDTQGNILQEVVSGEDGVVHITDLLAGSYIIRELETVEGFTRSDEVIELVIDENYVVPEKLQRFVNYPSIETGVDLEMTPIAWAGVALVALAVGLILFGRKNSRKSKRK